MKKIHIILNNMLALYNIIYIYIYILKASEKEKELKFT